MCTGAKVGEQRGGGWVLWVQQQSWQVNPCSPNTRASQNSGGPPSFSYFANLSTANLLLTSSLLSSPPLPASMAALRLRASSPTVSLWVTSLVGTEKQGENN